MNRREERQRPLYMISVAAELAGVHPQTLRIYERRELVNPQRSAGNTRLYSQEDIDRLRLIQQLTQEEGINLAGVERIIALERELDRLRADVEAAHRRALAAERVARELARSARETRTAIVHVRHGAVVRFG